MSCCALLVALLADLFGVVEPEDVVFTKDYSEAGSEFVRLFWSANFAVQELKKKRGSVEFKSGMPSLVTHRLATWRNSECDYAVLIVKETMLL